MNKMLTADQLTAKLFSPAAIARRTAIAEMRVRLAAELGLSPFDPQVKREARRLVDGRSRT